MKHIRLYSILTVFLLVLLVSCDCRTDSNTNKLKSTNCCKHESCSEIDLPSWNEGATKTAIIDFVKRTTTEGSADFIPLASRIACFDMDGTLWCEQPLYFQMLFAADRVKELAPLHPEWKQQEPFKSVLNGDDVKEILGRDKDASYNLVVATHSGITNVEFDSIVNKWISTARHPISKKLYSEMVYKPMLELLNYLRLKGYKTFIVSGCGQGFMRPWSQEVFGIPSEQVVGTSLKSKYEIVKGVPQISILPELHFNNNNDGKPVGIYQQIGKHPVFTVGNSDGDYEMLQYTTAGEGAHFGMLIHHTDSVREYAYDRGSNIGRLEKGLDNAFQNKWVVVDMKRDWKEVFTSK